MRNALFVVFALLLALGAGWLIRSQLQDDAPAPEAQAPADRQAQQEKAAQPATVDVLVADRALEVGDLVAEGDVAVRDWPVGSVADAFFRASETEPAALAGRAVRRSVAAGQPFAAPGLVEPGDRSFLAAVLEPGMRALSITTTPASGVAGLVYPGDRVDLLLTRTTQEGRVSQDLLSNVRVVAVGRRMAHAAPDDAEDGGAARGAVVTLELTPKEAQRVAVAKNAGEIQLTLHSFAERGDGAPRRGAGVTRLDEVVSGGDGPTRSIRLIQGDSERSVEVDAR